MDSLHPNASLLDVDLPLRDRHEILLAPWSGVMPPIGRTEAVSVFGDPGSGEGASPRWIDRHMVLANDLGGTWGVGKGRLYVNKAIEAPLREALSRLEKAGFIDQIKSIGCYNYRRQRHSTDPKVPLSWHAYGAALDINPDLNYAIYRRYSFQGPRHRPVDQPFSGNWRELWPRGLSWEVVETFKAVGFTWGGDWHSFVDPMHFEWVR